MALRAAAVAREQDLMALYDRAVAASPARAALLLGLRAEHAAHLAALGSTPVTTPSTSGPSTAPPSTAPPPPTAPTSPVDLPAAEAAASAAHAVAVIPASRGLAALLASLAAAEAAHAVALA